MTTETLLAENTRLLAENARLTDLCAVLQDELRQANERIARMRGAL